MSFFKFFSGIAILSTRIQLFSAAFSAFLGKTEKSTEKFYTVGEPLNDNSK
jgi:hypothetical protein